jgi:hypothetical protein
VACVTSKKATHPRAAWPILKLPWLLKMPCAERLLLRHRPLAERAGGNQGMSPAIRMRIGDWYVDEHGILTREIKARD